MGADSKNQVENMCCQHKIYDIIKEKFEAHIKDTPVYVFESVEEAMKKWDNRLMFATGSLYLVGDVDRALEGKENNHD